MRNLALVALFAGCLTGNAFVVKVDNLPDVTIGNSIKLKSLKSEMVLDSATVNGNQMTLTSMSEPGQWCSLVYSYPIKNGVRSDFVNVFADSDTITVDLAAGHGNESIAGGDLNHKNMVLKDRVKNLPKNANGGFDMAKATELLVNEISRNTDNAYGAYVLSMSTSVLPDSMWLALYETLSPEFGNYPNIRSQRDGKLKKADNAVGKKFSNLEIETADGEKATLYDYIGKGKYILIDFWASWCGPCRKEAKETLMPLYEKYKNDDRFSILGIITAEQPDNARSTAKNSTYPWTQVVDVDSNASATFGFSTIPQLMLIGPDGTLLYREIRGQEIFDAVAKVLSSR